MFNQLVRDVEHVKTGNPADGVLSEITTPTTRRRACAPPEQPFSPAPAEGFSDLRSGHRLSDEPRSHSSAASLVSMQSYK